MRIGQIGILSKDFFESRVEKWAYITTAVDVTDYWQQQFPEKNLIGKTYYDLRYQIVKKKDASTCTLLYLGNVVTPYVLMSEGHDHKISSYNTDRWKYHKVLITIDDRSEVRFIHENCLSYFTWYFTKSECKCSHEDVCTC